MGAVERKAIDEATKRACQQVEIGELGVSRVGTAKGNARSSQHRNAPHLRLSHLVPFPAL
jgi:hypothetical protein